MISFLALGAAALLGFTGGLFLFKVKSRWCRRCGSVLSCPSCGHGVRPHPDSSRQASRRHATFRSPRCGRGGQAANCGKAGGVARPVLQPLDRRIVDWRTQRKTPQQFWPFKRRRTIPLDRLGTATRYIKRAAAYRAIGVAPVTYLPERPLLTLAGEYRAGYWS